MHHTYQHANKCGLPSSILSQHHNYLGISKLSFQDIKLETTLNFSHSWILVPCICLNFFSIFLWCFSNLKKVYIVIHNNYSGTRHMRNINLPFHLTLKIRDSSLKRKFSVGTKPAKKILIPSLTEKGSVTTP